MLKAEPVVIPKLMRVLEEKRIPAIKSDSVCNFKRDVYARELDTLRAAYKDKHLVVRLTLGHHFCWVILAIATTVGILAIFFRSELLASIGAVFAITSLLLLESWAKYKIGTIVGTGWQTSRFLDFRSEYSRCGRTVAYEVCTCYHPQGKGCDDPNIVPEVEWHEESSTRFLRARHRDKPSDPIYYVDQWDKPE